MIRTQKPLEAIDLDLLLLHGVDQHRREPIVLDAFDLALGVMGDQERLHVVNFFRDQPQVTLPTLFPIERDGVQLAQQIETRVKLAIWSL